MKDNVDRLIAQRESFLREQRQTENATRQAAYEAQVKLSRQNEEQRILRLQTLQQNAENDPLCQQAVKEISLSMKNPHLSKALDRWVEQLPEAWARKSIVPFLNKKKLTFKRDFPKIIVEENELLQPIYGDIGLVAVDKLAKPVQMSESQFYQFTYDGKVTIVEWNPEFSTRTDYDGGSWQSFDGYRAGRTFGNISQLIEHIAYEVANERLWKRERE